ncbi:unnamed protein product, partial [Cylicostephanus goldi]
ECPISFFDAYRIYVIVAACIAALLIIAIVVVILIALRERENEKKRQDALWKIHFHKLRKPVHKSRSQSFTSAVSGVSGRSGDMSEILDWRTETDKLCYFYHGAEPLTAFKHTIVLRFDEVTNAEFRKMRQIEHDNLNRFVGVAVDTGLIYSLWKFCPRGTLQEVITKGSLPMDTVFIRSMMMDIASGLHFIHESAMHVHGRLTSQVLPVHSCMVDDRWQVKISYYGMTCIKEYERRTEEACYQRGSYLEQLWTAPEILRGEVDDIGTQPGDVYSFAIIASELVTKKTAWDLDNRKENADDIIRKVTKPSMDPFRPALEIHESIEIIPSLINLIRECWSEWPRHRPEMKKVKSLLSSMQTGKKLNLMDHVMNTLENYASSLEAEVEERMKELVEEKKKSDVLLYRMLPRCSKSKISCLIAQSRQNCNTCVHFGSKTSSEAFPLGGSSRIYYNLLLA